MAKIGIMGGTFDPIHIGHLLAAEEVRAKLHLERIIFVPSGKPPFKGGTVQADARHRLIMCELACASNPHFEVSDVEILREGVSYTVDTITHFAQIYPYGQLHLIVGADVPAGFHKWKNFDEIERLCEIVVTTRPGSGLSEIDSKYHQVAISDIDVSSSKVRQRLMESGSAQYLVHDAVGGYIRKHDLYESEIWGIKRVLEKELSSLRYRHSLEVMDEAVRLGQHYKRDNATIAKLRLAGLLHDCAKNLCEERPYDDLVKICNVQNIQLPEFFRENYELAHSYVGMAVAADFYGVTDPCVLSAIGSHTFAKPDMSFVDKAIYLADFIEPTRPASPVRFEVRRLAYHNLDEALIHVLQITIDRITSRGLPDYGESRRALAYLTECTNLEESNE